MPSLAGPRVPREGAPAAATAGPPSGRAVALLLIVLVTWFGTGRPAAADQATADGAARAATTPPEAPASTPPSPEKAPAGAASPETAAETWRSLESSAADAAWQPAGSSPLWMAGRVLLAVVLVVTLAVLLLLLLRRFGMPSSGGVGAPRLRLLANLALGPRRQVYLVRVDGVELLVGSAGDGLRLLTELPAPRDAAQATPAAGGSSSAATSRPAAAAPAAAPRRASPLHDQGTATSRTPVASGSGAGGAERHAPDREPDDLPTPAPSFLTTLCRLVEPSNGGRAAG